MKKNRFFIAASLIIILTGCSPWLYVTVKPSNFAEIQSSYGTFLFGSYYIDKDQSIFLSFKGDDPDMYLNRIRYNSPAPGSPDSFIIPIPAKDYIVRSINFIDGPYSDYNSYIYDPYSYPGPDFIIGYYGRYRHSRIYWDYYWNYNDYRYYCTPKIFPYHYGMNLEKDKAYYFGRIIMTNGNISVENRFEEDKAMLLSNFKSDAKALSSISNLEFVNLLK